LVDSRPRMNTRFGARPTDGCMTVNDGWKAGWEGSGTRRRGQGESGSCMSDDARTEIQCASQTPPTPQYNSPELPSLPLAHPPDLPVQNLPDLHHPIRFQGDAERIANGPRIASATAGHSASIPRSLSAVLIFLFTFLARHARPLNKVRCWRTRIAPLAHTRCAPIRHSHAHSGGNRGVHLSGHALRQRFRKDRARCGGVRSDSSPNPRAHLRAHGCCQETDARVHDVQTSRDCLCAPGSSSGARLPHGFVIHNGVGDERTAFALGGAHP
jgi:hypothetical protein